MDFHRGAAMRQINRHRHDGMIREGEPEGRSFRIRRRPSVHLNIAITLRDTTVLLFFSCI